LVYAVSCLVNPFSNVSLLPSKLHAQQRNRRNDAAA
jgi:BarA-like signal transduction histidine kinase